MSASQRILSSLSLCLSFPLRSSSSSSSSRLNPRFLFLRSSPFYVTLPRSSSQSPSPPHSLSMPRSSSPSPSPPHSLSMPRLKTFCRTTVHMISNFANKIYALMAQKWKENPGTRCLSTDTEASSTSLVEDVTNRLDGLSVGESSTKQADACGQPTHFGNVQIRNQVQVAGQKAICKPRSYVTASGATTVEAKETTEDQISSAALTKFINGNLLEGFTVDKSTYAHAQIRATFYPKFENEKSDQEVRTRMIEMVSKGLATLEVSLKHSGSLFMYAGHKGGAYAKNSFGNIYTAVGVFVLGRMFQQAWGAGAAKKQAEFNEFLETSRISISMELVTAVLGDHGQRPREDYAVVTAVTELGKGKAKFYSTPEIIAFCRKWRLPTNHVWLFSTRKSAMSFFAAYDALCEEGTATPVCKALDEVADISVPGSVDHVKAQGEILEGLVARIVSHDSSKHMEQVLKDFPPPPVEGASLDLGPSLRDICAANRSDENQQMKALLQSIGKAFCPDHSDWIRTDAGDAHSRNAGTSIVSKFLQCHPADFSTTKVQEMVRLMREQRFPANFKCFHNFHKVDSASSKNLFYKMVIHVRSDSAFRRYQKEMRHKPGLWPLYRGFFVDINLFKEDKEKAAELAKNGESVLENDTSAKNGLADEDANLMIKLKFLTYKIRTFLIRNGLSILFTEGPASYRTYYLRQIKLWGTSAGKQRELEKMLNEWAKYIKEKYGSRRLSTSAYLSEAEPFLENYAKLSPQNQALVGAAGNLVRTEDFMAIVDSGWDEEGDLQTERGVNPPSPYPSVKDSVLRDEGLIVFFPGIPGCAKSALCKELLKAPGGLGDDRPIQSLMGDLIKGKYWQMVADERRKKPYSIMLADKNAPNEEVWRQIEDMCRSTRAAAVPVVSDSEGTDSNPFSLDALAVYMYRVIQRVNHPGKLDKASQNAGYVLLMFYNLYEGKSRKDFDSELIERFGSLVKMPLLKSDRSPLPDSVKSVLEEGSSLYNLHRSRHGRLESTKGTYVKEWAKWEKQLREVLFANADYLNSVQVPFELAVSEVLEQLTKIAKGEYKTPDTVKRNFGTIIYAAVSLPVTEIKSLLDALVKKNPQAEAVLGDKDFNNLTEAHVTLAHKRSHGVVAVANYGIFLHKQVPISLHTLLFNDEMAAFEADLGSVDGERVVSKNEWPHVTVWTAEGVAAKEANRLPELLADGKASCIQIDPPVTISGILEFF